jgi:hypothetical protein
MGRCHLKTNDSGKAEGSPRPHFDEAKKKFFMARYLRYKKASAPSPIASCEEGAVFASNPSRR